MAKLTLPDPTTYRLLSLAQITQAFNAIETWSDTVVSRDGTSPNQLEVNWDLNSNYLLNTPIPLLPGHVANKDYVDQLFNSVLSGELSLSSIEALIAANTSAIDTKASIVYVDSVIAGEASARATSITNIQTQVDDNATGIVSKASITYVDQAISTVNTSIATTATGLQASIDDNTNDISTRATITYVDTTVATETSARATSEAALTAAYQADDVTLGNLISTNSTDIGDLQVDLLSKATITYVDTAVADETSARATSEAIIEAAYQGADAQILAGNANLIPNPTGHNGLNGWNNSANWAAGDSTLGRYITTTTVGIQNIDSVPIDVTAGGTYTLSFNAGGATFTAGEAQLIWRNGSGTTISTDTVAIASGATFPRLSDSFVAPGAAADVIVRFTCNLSSGFFLFFRSQLEEAGYQSPYGESILLTSTLARVTTAETSIATNTASIATIEVDLTAEFEAADALVTSAFQAADTTQQGEIDQNASDIASNVISISTKAAISYVDSVIATEQSARASAISSLTSTVNIKATVFRQNSAPVANVVGDLWIDANGNNRIYRWSGSSWVEVTDARIPTIATNTANITSNSSTIASNTSAIASQETTLRAEFQAADSGIQSQVTGNSNGIATNVSDINSNSTAISNETSARAAADTTLTASVNGNTTSINVNASVLADVEGNLAARYAITTGGTFISLEDGTTTPGTITLSASQVRLDAEDIILDGTIKEANIGDLEVDTIKIAGGAVSDSAFTAQSGNSASIVHAARQGSVLLFAIFYPTSTSSRTVFLKRGATTLRSFTISSSVPIIIMYVDVPPATTTYTYQATSTGAMNATELLLLEVVR